MSAPDDRLERRLALAIVALATGWFAACAAWGLFGPLLAGHYASSASVGIIADNMLRWGIAGPVWEYTAGRPRPEQYYCHHPWGIFWTTAGFMKVLGRHDFVCRLPAVLLSAATPPLLYLLGRAMWRPAAGALAAAAFVVLPITLSFAHFNALEVPVIAWSTLGLWGWVRYQQSWQKRHLAASLAGFALALHADWPAYVLVAALLGFDLLRMFAPRRWGRVRFVPHARGWALTVALCAFTLLLYLYLFARSRALAELFGSYQHRSAGAEEPLRQVLASRRYWIELSFTPVAIVLGVVGAVVCALRLVVKRQGSEVVPLAVLAMASVQYLVFKQGADVHVFWPHYFAAYFALAAGALAESALRLLERLPRLGGRGALLATLGAFALPLALVLRDGAAALPYARATGGRFNEKGLFIESEGEKIAFLRWLPLPDRAELWMHESMNTNWSQIWSLGGRVVRPRVPLPAPGARGGHLVLDARRLAPGELRRLAAAHRTVAVGPFWYVTVRAPASPIEVHRFVEREPTAFEWYFRGGTEPIRSIAPDAYAGWELRTHLGQPAEPPADAPVSFDERRVAHNMAVERGDEPSATKLFVELAAELGEPRARFADGSELVGVRYTPGARPILLLLLRAAGASPDLVVAVRSRVVARARWSTTMTDPTVRAVGPPPSLPPGLWRAGYLYGYEVPIRKRPGTEVFELSVGGSPFVEVLRLR